MKDESPALPLAALRLWDDRARAGSGAWNMAVDEALLTGMAHSPVPVLRIYRWERPTLSFGYFLPLAEALAALSHGETLIRRWTGGGLVHHAAAVTWSLVVPHAEAFCRLRPGQSYAQLHLALAHALCGMGLQEISVVPAEAAAPTGPLGRRSTARPLEQQHTPGPTPCSEPQPRGRARPGACRPLTTAAPRARPKRAALQPTARYGRHCSGPPPRTRTGRGRGSTTAAPPAGAATRPARCDCPGP